MINRSAVFGKTGGGLPSEDGTGSRHRACEAGAQVIERVRNAGLARALEQEMTEACYVSSKAMQSAMSLCACTVSCPASVPSRSAAAKSFPWIAWAARPSVSKEDRNLSTAAVRQSGASSSASR